MNSELGLGPPKPPDTARLACAPKLGRGDAESRPPSATLEDTCRGCDPKEGEEIPKPEKPLADPVEVGGGPRDCRVNLAGLEGLTGVTGEGPGEGDRWGRSVWDMVNGRVDLGDGYQR